MSKEIRPSLPCLGSRPPPFAAPAWPPHTSITVTRRHGQPRLWPSYSGSYYSLPKVVYSYGTSFIHAVTEERSKPDNPPPCLSSRAGLPPMTTSPRFNACMLTLNANAMEDTK
jgi:hypothetical protein